MKSNRLTVVIIKPIAGMYAFTVDPKNVPKWHDYKTEMEYFEWVEEGCLKTEYRQSNAAKCGVSVWMGER